MISRNRSASPAGPLGRFAIPALLVLAGLLGACTDPLTVKATDENVTQPFSVHALSGSQLSYATALFFPLRTVARVDGSFAFDIAFDLNAQGDVILLPVTVVGQNPSGNRRVGIVKPGLAFDAVTEAPKSGYTVDSVTVVRRGEPAVVQAQETACSLSLTPYYYAKVVVDSIDLPSRTMFGRVMINSNCGFRSLSPGLPGF
jgi:hypothetical protein